MNVVPDRFFELDTLRDIAINRDLEQVWFAMSETPEQTIKERPALRIAMERDEPGEGEEFFRNTKFGSANGEARIGFVEKMERGLIFAEFFPNDFVRREVALQGATRQLLPSLEGGKKADLLHRAIRC